MNYHLLKIKIKYYLKPYLTGKRNYYPRDNTNKISKYYWISGHQNLVKSKKLNFEDGIPLGMFSNSSKKNLSERVHISGMCECIIAFVELDRFSDAEKIANFIVANLKYDSFKEIDYAVWRTYDGRDSYFVHGMGQGELLSSLIRLENYFQNKYRSTITKIFNSFLIPFEHKDGFVEISNEKTIIHEYPKGMPNEMKGHSVLNGWCFGILGLYDFTLWNEDNTEAKLLLKNNINYLIRSIDQYDIGCWTLYNMPKKITNIASFHYHEIHISLINFISKISGSRKLYDYALKFESYIKNPFLRIISLLIKISGNIYNKGNVYRYK